MTAVDDVSAVVLETTSDRVRAGFAGSACPSCVRLLPELTTGPESLASIQDAWRESLVSIFGAGEAMSEDNRPAESESLGSERTPLLLVEPAQPWEQETRQELVRFAFETLHVPAVYLMRSAVATTFAWARKTALVLHIDRVGAVAAPVLEGYLLLNCLRSDPLVGLPWPQRDSSTAEMTRLPLKKVEAKLFPRLTRLVFDAIMAADIDVRRELFYNVIVTGDGLSQLEEQALVQRLDETLGEVCPHLFRPRVVNASNEQLFHPGVSAAWVGASLCGTLGVFHQLWVSRSDWEASPPSILEDRCP
jgi:actin-related protein